MATREKTVLISYKLFIAFLMLSTFSDSAIGQGFGKNKVQYNDFKWEFIQSEHFDVYFICTFFAENFGHTIIIIISVGQF